MKIAIIGSGAMGSLFGGLLAEAGEDVTLVDVWKEHVDAINTYGLKITGVCGEKIVKVRATTDSSKVGLVDLILIFVKSYDTRKATMDALPMVGSNTVFLTLQNGLGNYEQIAQVVGSERVIPGVTTHGSTLIAPGEIYHAGSGVTIIGEISGEITTRVKRIAEIFNRAEIKTEVSRNILGVIWSKVIINVGINAVTALTGIKNGELLEVPELKEVARKAVLEAVKVSQKAGIKLEVNNPVDEMFRIAKLTSENKSSMLQDIERGRKTEIEAINGTIVKIGKKYGVKTPINETLTALIKGLEFVISRRKQAVRRGSTKL